MLEPRGVEVGVRNIIAQARNMVQLCKSYLHTAPLTVTVPIIRICLLKRAPTLFSHPLHSHGAVSPGLLLSGQGFPQEKPATH